MKKFALLLVLLPFVAVAQKPSPSATPPTSKPEMDAAERLDALDAAQIKLATDAIRKQHVEAATLDETGLARATLRGLLDGLYPGADLTGTLHTKTPDAPLRSENLNSDVGYIRLGALTAENLAPLDVALGDFNAAKISSLVLDLRATPASEDYALTAQFAARFVPKDTALFSLVHSAEKSGKPFSAQGEPIFRGVVAVLVDEDTAGAAEALAAVLRRHDHAMIVGERTAGRAVEFASLDLGGGNFLRYAVAEARVDGLPPIYPRGVEPDLEVAQAPEDKKAILDAALEKGISGFVFEKGRPQLNESALISRTNPEIDAEKEPSHVLDRPLQRAVDLVTAIKLFRQRE